MTLRRPELRAAPFVLVSPVHGRMIISAANQLAEEKGLAVGMTAADAKAIIPSLQIIDDIPGKDAKLLKALGEWCIRYSPLVSVDIPDGLILDISGCTYLWGGERLYLKEIITRLNTKGYDVRGAIADTAGAAWAIAHFGRITPFAAAGKHLVVFFFFFSVVFWLVSLVLVCFFFF